DAGDQGRQTQLAILPGKSPGDGSNRRCDWRCAPLMGLFYYSHLGRWSDSPFWHSCRGRAMSHCSNARVSSDFRLAVSQPAVRICSVGGSIAQSTHQRCDDKLTRSSYYFCSGLIKENPSITNSRAV